MTLVFPAPLISAGACLSFVIGRGLRPAAPVGSLVVVVVMLEVLMVRVGEAAALVPKAPMP